MHASSKWVSECKAPAISEPTLEDSEGIRREGMTFEEKLEGGSVEK